MDLKTVSLEKAVKAAKDLGLESVPWAWIIYIQNGWELENSSCSCIPNWVWMKPYPSGTMHRFGCVSEKVLDVNDLMNTKQNSSNVMRARLEELKPLKEDVGKIFYTHLGSDEISITTQEGLRSLNPSEVGFWLEINEFDVYGFNRKE